MNTDVHNDEQVGELRARLERNQEKEKVRRRLGAYQVHGAMK